MKRWTDQNEEIQLILYRQDCRLCLDVGIFLRSHGCTIARFPSLNSAAYEGGVRREFREEGGREGEEEEV